MQLAFQAEGRGFEPRLPLHWKSDSYRKKLPDFFFYKAAGLTVSLTVLVKPRVKPETIMNATITVVSDLHYTRIYDIHRLKQNESNWIWKIEVEMKI